VRQSSRHASKPIVVAGTALVLGMLACNLPGTGGTAAPPATSPPEIAASVTPALPSDTPIPAATETPSETPTPSDTPTLTATPGPDFSQATVYAVSHLTGKRLLVTIQVPGGVEGDFTASVDSTPMTCEILAQYPDRLYCTGPEPYVNYSPKSAAFTLFPAGSPTVVFQTTFTIPGLPTPTPTPSKTPSPTP
jgi:hypothetical protein